MSLLEVKNLNLWYREKQVLFDVSFEVKIGEILCIVGESGSGKSSILFTILRLLPPYARVSGSVKFLGRELLKLSEREMKSIRGKEVGMVFQEPSLYLDPLFTVGSQIEETYLSHFKAGRREAYEACIKAMKKAGIPKPEEKYRMYPHQLSGGLKQRVCIANAIVCEPKLVLADEPTTALDVSVQRRILALFRNMKEEGKAVILITHDFGVVAEVGDRVIVLKDGKVVEEGDVFEIFDNPKHEYTKKLLSAI
ncbi:ABC transporter ATP-binding protein [Aquifex aeolicus]|uniref:ABC transporter n=1 Tax=Aquifex aeolicus (strain VF5) TaxID=224324 RepID=O67913_AQUAE|nr:ABC transporter ATP-binding protein [Aquifex aeolicus]AAC07884.1 ABC transporter [Aquifex aeolicus VF5]